MKTLQYSLLCAAVLVLTACNKNTGEFSSTSSKTPKGNANSPVVLTEYADLQCPACKTAHEQVTPAILEKYGNTVRFEFKHFPLRQIHPHALNAAQAAECAADQGKFWEFLDIAFENQASLSGSIYKSWGQAIGIANVDTFVDCIDSDAKRDLVIAEYNEGRELGVNGTPTLFVNGVKVQTTVESVSAAIDAEITRIKGQL